MERRSREAGAEIAAVIVEPVAGNMNLVAPRAGFLETLRALCTRHGALLIFDEVMTGFRVALGGAQAALRHHARSDDARQGHRRRHAGRRVRRPARHHGDDRAARARSTRPERCRAIPVAVAAGLATLKLVQAPGFFESIAATTRALCEGLTQAAREQRASASARRASAACSASTSARRRRRAYAEVMQCDRDAFNRFFHAMLAQGVYLAPSAYEAGFVSSAHGAAEIEQTIEAAEKAFAGQRG